MKTNIKQPEADFPTIDKEAKAELLKIAKSLILDGGKHATTNAEILQFVNGIKTIWEHTQNETLFPDYGKKELAVWERMAELVRECENGIFILEKLQQEAGQKRETYRQREYEARREANEKRKKIPILYTDRASKLDITATKFSFPDKPTDLFNWSAIRELSKASTETIERVKTAILELPKCGLCRRTDGEESLFSEFVFSPSDFEKIIDNTHPERVNKNECLRLLEILNNTRLYIDVTFNDGKKRAVPMEFIRFGTADTEGDSLFISLNKSVFDKMNVAITRQGKAIPIKRQFVREYPSEIIRDKRARLLAHQFTKGDQFKYHEADLLQLAEIDSKHTTKNKTTLKNALEKLVKCGIITSYERKEEINIFGKGVFYTIEKPKKKQKKQDKEPESQGETKKRGRKKKA